MCLQIQTRSSEVGNMEVLLISGSTIDEGRLAKGGDKFTEEYTLECASCWISPADFVPLCSPDKVKVTSRDGKHSIVVYAKCTDSFSPGRFSCRGLSGRMLSLTRIPFLRAHLYKGAPYTLSRQRRGPQRRRCSNENLCWRAVSMIYKNIVCPVCGSLR